MTEFLYQSGWGALTIMLLFQVPFIVVFLSMVYRKAFVNNEPNATSSNKLGRIEMTWIGVAIALFVIVNIASIQYMPMVSSAHAAKTIEGIDKIDVTAQSWSFDISKREIVAGKPVAISAKSIDTMHSMTVYHPDGRVLFTLQLMPGTTLPAEYIYTFKDPGTYKIRCLEYCGIAHHAMQDEFTVVASND